MSDTAPAAVTDSDVFGTPPPAPATGAPAPQKTAPLGGNGGPVAVGMYPAGGDTYYRVNENGDVSQGNYSTLGDRVQVEPVIGNVKGLAQTMWDATIAKGRAAAAPQTPPTPPPSGPPPQVKPGEVGDKDVFGPGLDSQPATPTQAQPTNVGETPGGKLNTTNVGRSVVNGFTLGFEPDLAAAGSYVGAQINNVLNNQHEDAWQKAVQTDNAERQSQQEFAQAHPFINAGAGIAGTLVNPLTYMGGAEVAGAKTAVEAGLAAAKAGATIGTVSGIGEAGGDLGHRLQGGVEGGAMGALGGAALGAGGKYASSAIGTLAAGARDTFQATDTAIGALKAKGIDYSALPQGARDDIAAGIKAGQDPTQTAFAAIAKHQPGGGVPLTQGELEANPAKMLQEENHLVGATTGNAQRQVKGFKGAQQEQLAAAGKGVKQQIAGGQDIQRGEAGRAISGKLNATKAAMKAKVDARFDRARAMGETSHLSEDHTAALFRSVRYGLYDEHGGPEASELLAPKTHKLLNKIESIINPEGPSGTNRTLPSAKPLMPKGYTAENWAKLPQAVRDAYQQEAARGMPQPSNRGASVNDLFSARRALQTIARNPMHEERAAATIALKRLDAGIKTAIEQDLLKGDPQAIAAWKVANKGYQHYSGLFKGNDLVQTLTATAPRGGDFHALKVSPEDATNKILGSEGIGALTGQNMQRNLDALKHALGGEHSAEWQALKGEIAGRFLEMGGSTHEGAEAVSGAKLASAWNRAKVKFPDVLNKIFTHGDQQLIQRYVTTADRATTRLKGGQGSSNTAVQLKSLVKGAGKMARVLPWIDQLANKVGDHMQNLHATQATAGAKPLTGSAATRVAQKSLTSPTLQKATVGQGVRGTLDYYGGP